MSASDTPVNPEIPDTSDATLPETDVVENDAGGEPDVVEVDGQLVQSPAAALQSLKDRATKIGLRFHPSISFEKLKEKIQEHLDRDDSAAAPAAHVTATSEPTKEDAPVVETENQKRTRLKREALALVRIRMTCLNPAKREWEGEIFTSGNSLIGSVSKYVPYNNDEGWHVPKIILNMIKSRECQIFVSVRNNRGQMERKSKMIKEFAIEILPDLTADEIAELARRQAAAKSID